MIYIYVPLAVVILWNLSAAFNRDKFEIVASLIEAAILCGSTSALIYGSEQALTSLLKDRPEMAILALSILAVALISIAWLKFRFQGPR